MSETAISDAPMLPQHRGEFRVLTCIMPAGRGAEVMEALRREAGVINACAHHARGMGTGHLRHRAYADEKQVITTLVEAGRADDVFHFLYHAAGLDTAHAGMIMMGRAFRGTGVVPLPQSSEDPR